MEMAQLKDEGQLKGLIVTGCLAQRFKEEIMTEIPQVDAVIGATAYDEIASVMDKVAAGEENIISFKDISYLPHTDTKRVVTTGGYFSYLKIAEGCDKHCSYCIIPSLKGNFRSVPMEEILQDAKDLAEKGVKELNIVAQETTVYGVDLYGKKMLHELLRKLCAVEGIEWIRLLYCYPEEIYDELIGNNKNRT